MPSPPSSDRSRRPSPLSAVRRREVATTAFGLRPAPLLPLRSKAAVAPRPKAASTTTATAPPCDASLLAKQRRRPSPSKQRRRPSFSRSAARRLCLTTAEPEPCQPSRSSRSLTRRRLYFSSFQSIGKHNKSWAAIFDYAVCDFSSD